MTKENGLLSWLLTSDHKRIAILYLISITFFFFIGGALAGLIRLELLTPQTDLMATDTYNKVFTMHGVIMIFLFLVPSVPATLGNFLHSHDDRGQGPGAAQDQPAELVSVHDRRHAWSSTPWRSGGVDTGWTFTTPLSTHYREHQRADHRPGRLHRRIQFHLHRAELHRHHPQDARAGNDLVPAAAVCVVALRGQHSHGAGHAGSGHRHGAGRAGAHAAASAFSTRPRAAIRCCSSICSGSTRTRPSTS